MTVVAAASANASRWIAQADASCSRDPRLSGFRDACKVSGIGSNVTAEKLDHFRQLVPARIVSSYTVEEARTDPSIAFTTVYANDEWGPRRLAVETALEAVRLAVYGTIDLPGCAGDYRYGFFRLVYSAPESGVLVFPHNTALAYAPTGALISEKIKAEAAAWPERAELCVETVGAEAVEIAPAQWGRLLGSERGEENVDLVEVVVLHGERRLDEVDEIRVESRRFRALVQGALTSLLRPQPTDLAIHIAAQLLAEAEDGLVKLVQVEVELE